jgi:16S rRNA (cytosine1402-N4)-methyltransferase
MAHIPVLADEVIKFLDPKKNENFIDCTLGDGGHSAELLRRTAPKGKVLGFDLDSEAVKVVRKNLEEFGSRLIVRNESYANLNKAVAEEKFEPADGVLMDFGFSSPQLEDRGRGFSFQRDEPLDMSYSTAADHLTAAEIVNVWTKDEITRVLAEFGEERLAERIAAKIVSARHHKHIISTVQLVEVIKAAVPKNYEHGRIHPATRTFQALRIAVNGELDSVNAVLPQALAALKPGGRLVCISFHSLEDRLVKSFFKEMSAKRKIEILTPKPITATEKEIQNNPRSRSAKLRAAIVRSDT